MSEGFASYDIIIIALIAGFVLLRLRAVLGQKIGQDTPPPFDYRAADSEAPVVKLQEKTARALTDEEKDDDKQLVDKISDVTTVTTLAAIKMMDPDFTLKTFLDGARMAFEMAHDAFNKDDRDTLKMLLSAPLYDVFSAELDARKTGDNRTETTLLAVQTAEAKNVRLEKNMARITVRYVSEQVSVVRDKGGKIVEGDPGAAHNVEDEWVFERDVGSRNPNWKIIDT